VIAPPQSSREEEKKAENKTGLPDSLKEGIESLSGFDLSGVRVNYNSPKPAQLNAHAYTQGQKNSKSSRRDATPKEYPSSVFSSRRRCRSYPLSRRTPWSVRAFRDGDYAGGIGHGIGATLSFGGAASELLGSAGRTIDELEEFSSRGGGKGGGGNFAFVGVGNKSRLPSKIEIEDISSSNVNNKGRNFAASTNKNNIPDGTSRNVFTPSNASELLKSQERVVLELFGGKTGKVSEAINVDIIAEQGIIANLLTDKLSFIPDNSVDEIVTFNPFIPKDVGGRGIADFLPESARVLKPGGQIIISGTKSNKFTKLKPSLLAELNLEIVEKQIPLPKRFSQLEFFQTDGVTPIPKDKIVTSILKKTK